MQLLQIFAFSQHTKRKEKISLLHPSGGAWGSFTDPGEQDLRPIEC